MKTVLPRQKNNNSTPKKKVRLPGRGTESAGVENLEKQSVSLKELNSTEDLKPIKY